MRASELDRTSRSERAETRDLGEGEDTTTTTSKVNLPPADIPTVDTSSDRRDGHNG